MPGNLWSLSSNGLQAELYGYLPSVVEDQTTILFIHARPQIKSSIRDVFLDHRASIPSPALSRNNRLNFNI